MSDENQGRYGGRVRVQRFPIVIPLRKLCHPSPAALQQARPAMQEAADDFVALLRGKDGDASQQGYAIFAWLQYAPEDPQVVDAIEDYFSQPLPSSVRTGALNELRNPHTKNVRIIDVVIASLKDPEAEVRSTAVHVLIFMGAEALARARPALEGLDWDPNQPANVKDAVKKVLEEIRHHVD